MSARKPEENKSSIITFEPILPETGFFFYEECPTEHEIDPPILLPLKTTTQLRFEELQRTSVRDWKEKQKSTNKKQ